MTLLAHRQWEQCLGDLNGQVRHTAEQEIPFKRSLRQFAAVCGRRVTGLDFDFEAYIVVGPDLSISSPHCMLCMRLFCSAQSGTRSLMCLRWLHWVPHPD